MEYKYVPHLTPETKSFFFAKSAEKFDIPISTDDDLEKLIQELKQEAGYTNLSFDEFISYINSTPIIYNAMEETNFSLSSLDDILAAQQAISYIESLQLPEAAKQGVKNLKEIILFIGDEAKKYKAGEITLKEFYSSYRMVFNDEDIPFNEFKEIFEIK